MNPTRPPRAAAEPPDLPHPTPWRARMFEVIFGHDTRAGKAFDVALLATILGSVAAVMAESVPRIQATWGRELYLLEWGFTLLFLGEYVLRLLCVREPARYAMSFFGIVDLMAIVPTFLSFLVPGGQELIVVRAVRLLRIFRVLKLSEYNTEARHLLGADWFDAKTHPLMSFRCLQVQQLDDGHGRIDGELTVRGVTRLQRDRCVRVSPAESPHTDSATVNERRGSPCRWPRDPRKPNNSKGLRGCDDFLPGVHVR